MYETTVLTAQNWKAHFAFDLAIPTKLLIGSVPDSGTAEISKNSGFPLHSDKVQ